MTAQSGSSPGPRPAISEARSSPTDGCPFCFIAECYQPFNPRQPPSRVDAAIRPTISDPQPETFIVLSTPLLVAFLDIAPLARGHLLLCPRKHREKLTAVDPSEASELGGWLRVLSAALVKSTGVDDWNVVQNNGAAAAQVVPHAHFHIIPRPELREQGRWRDQFTMFGRGTRTDLDDDDAAELAEKIRHAVASVLEEEIKAKL